MLMAQDYFVNFSQERTCNYFKSPKLLSLSCGLLAGAAYYVQLFAGEPFFPGVNGTCSPGVSLSSIVKAPDRCTGGHGFDSRRGLRLTAVN